MCDHNQPLQQGWCCNTVGQNAYALVLGDQSGCLSLRVEGVVQQALSQCGHTHRF